jgi:hypothetical protein
VAVVAVVAATGGGSTRAPARAPAPATVTPPARTVAPAPRRAPRRAASGLVLGVTEANPPLLAPGASPPGFAVWRDRLAALRPRYLRLLIDWAHVQPTPAPPNWAAPADGCLRGHAPCAPYAGVRDQLRAAAAAGVHVVFTFLNTPAWAAAPAVGCERAGTGPQSRLPSDPAHFTALVRSLVAEARADGVSEAWWSAWNEPNHPAFLNPQRARCDSGAPTLAARGYAILVRAMQRGLAGAAAPQHLVLGDVAGIDAPHTHATGAAEFAAALPSDVACLPGVWAQHAYVVAPGPLGGDDHKPPGSEPLLHGVERALAGHGCGGPPPHFWITETGVEARVGTRGCHAMARALGVWARDPRVDAAFQYTFRDDTAFPVGLADAALSGLHSAYAAWHAYAGGARPVAQPC